MCEAAHPSWTDSQASCRQSPAPCSARPLALCYIHISVKEMEFPSPLHSQFQVLSGVTGFRHIFFFFFKLLNKIFSTQIRAVNTIFTQHKKEKEKAEQLPLKKEKAQITHCLQTSPVCWKMQLSRIPHLILFRVGDGGV